MMKSRISRVRRGERGVTIILVAVAMVFMIMALAAIAIDIVALYTARSQANHAADAAALAGAKALANSGMTSDPTNGTLRASAQTLATQIATAVATAPQNKIGGQNITAGQVSVTFPNLGQPSFVISPQVSVTVRRSDLPTFFARAAGYNIASVSATAVAEAFNPSNSNTVSASGTQIPIAPQCVKPWILPNMDPNAGGAPFFNTTSGAINSTGTVGKSMTLIPACAGTGCTATPPTPPLAGHYYHADFLPPAASALPAACTLTTCAYEQNIAACSPQPITCGSAAALPNATIDAASCTSGYHTRTHTATQCLIHAPGIDSITVGGSPPTPPLSQPMQFIAGDDNPLVETGAVASGDQISTSDSLVTIPVSDQTTGWASSTNVNIIGFIQAFVTGVGTPASGQVFVTIVNMSGCGTGATVSPVLGDRISPVPVHLTSP